MTSQPQPPTPAPNPTMGGSVQKQGYVIRVGRQYLSRTFALVDDPRKALRYSRAYDAYRHAPSVGGCTYSLGLALEEQERRP